MGAVHEGAVEGTAAAAAFTPTDEMEVAPVQVSQESALLAQPANGVGKSCVQGDHGLRFDVTQDGAGPAAGGRGVEHKVCGATVQEEEEEEVEEVEVMMSKSLVRVSSSLTKRGWS